MTREQKVPVGAVGKGVGVSEGQGLVVDELVVDAPKGFGDVLMHELPKAATHPQHRSLHPAPIACIRYTDLRTDVALVATWGLFVCEVNIVLDTTVVQPARVHAALSACAPANPHELDQHRPQRQLVVAALARRLHLHTRLQRRSIPIQFACLSKPQQSTSFPQVCRYLYSYCIAAVLCPSNGNRKPQCHHLYISTIDQATTPVSQ